MPSTPTVSPGASPVPPFRRPPVQPLVVAVVAPRQPPIQAQQSMELQGQLSPTAMMSPVGPVPAQPDVVVELYATQLLSTLSDLEREHERILEAYGEGEPIQDGASVPRQDGSRASTMRAVRAAQARARRREATRARIRMAEEAAAAVEEFTSAAQAGAVDVMGGQAGLAAQDTAEVRSRAREFVDRNTALAESLPDAHFGQVAEVVSKAYLEGWTQERLATMLRALTGVTERRAAFIARNEIETLAGQMAQARQTSAGVKQYVWRTVGDDRVRDSHEAREGQTFSWDQPPPGGHPGEDFNCRCVAVPFTG